MTSPVTSRFFTQNGNFERNRQFRYLTASILQPNFLFLVDMCIQLWEIDKECIPIINLRPQVLLLGSNWRKIGRMLLIFTAPHFYVSSYKNSIFRSCTKSISVFDLLGDGISILVAQSVTVFIIEGISQKTYGLLINFYRQKPSFWPHFQPLSQILALFGCFLLWTTYTFLKIQTVSHQNLTFIQSDGLTCDFQIFYTEMSVKCVSQLEYCPTRTFSGKCMEKF